jgi:hypothetical protein
MHFKSFSPVFNQPIMQKAHGIPRSKYIVHFPMLNSFQRICPSLRTCVIVIIKDGYKLFPTFRTYVRHKVLEISGNELHCSKEGRTFFMLSDCQTQQPIKITHFHSVASPDDGSMRAETCYNVIRGTQIQ